MYTISLIVFILLLYFYNNNNDDDDDDDDDNNNNNNNDDDDIWLATRPFSQSETELLRAQLNEDRRSCAAG